MAPVEHGLILIDAERDVGFAPPDPFTGGIGRAAEIFSQGPGMAPAQPLEGGVNEIYLGLDTLHGLFITGIAIGKRG